MVSTTHQTITAVIPARNEQRNIERCLESVKWCDEIIVMDMGDDNTAAIAKKMGVKVVKRNASHQDNYKLVQENVNWAIDHAKSDWILRIDADEEVTPELKEELLIILEHGSDCAAYGVKRNQYFLGTFLKGGDWAYDRLIRFFKRDAARYDESVHVHEQFIVKGKIGYLQNALNHYSHPDFKTVVKKFQTYTDMQITDIHYSRPQAVYNLLTQPPYVFFRWMIWHHGYRDGIKGVIAGAMRGWYEFLLYKKYLSKLS